MVSDAMKNSSSAQWIGAAHTVPVQVIPLLTVTGETGSKAFFSVVDLGSYAKLIFQCGKGFWTPEWGHLSTFQVLDFSVPSPRV